MEVRAPNDLGYTCSSGKKKIIDYFLISRALVAQSEVSSKIAPWSTHVVVELLLATSVEQARRKDAAELRLYLDQLQKPSGTPAKADKPSSSGAAVMQARV